MVQVYDVMFSLYYCIEYYFIAKLFRGHQRWSCDWSYTCASVIRIISSLNLLIFNEFWGQIHHHVLVLPLTELQSHLRSYRYLKDDKLYTMQNTFTANISGYVVWHRLISYSTEIHWEGWMLGKSRDDLLAVIPTLVCTRFGTHNCYSYLLEQFHFYTCLHAVFLFLVSRDRTY